MIKRVHLVIAGRVQGVFFRQSLKVEARRRGALGWVRNLPDGKVEAVIEGEEGAVDALQQWCRTGPANSRVDAISSEPEDPAGEFGEFEVKY